MSEVEKYISAYNPLDASRLNEYTALGSAATSLSESRRGHSSLNNSKRTTMKLMLKSMALLGLMSDVASADINLLNGVDISAGTSDKDGAAWVKTTPSYDTIFTYDSGSWQVGINQAALGGQVSIQDSVLDIQIGASANMNESNWAAVKVDATQAGGSAPVTLSFDWVKSSSWGASTSFVASFDVTVVGYDVNGSSTALGTWDIMLHGGTTNLPNDTPLAGEVQSGSAEIDLSTMGGSYDSYGILVTSTREGSSGGCGINITNLTLSATPEPTTATLSLLALAGLCARRRRK